MLDVISEVAAGASEATLAAAETTASESTATRSATEAAASAATTLSALLAALTHLWLAEHLHELLRGEEGRHLCAVFFLDVKALLLTLDLLALLVEVGLDLYCGLFLGELLFVLLLLGVLLG